MAVGQSNYISRSIAALGGFYRRIKARGGAPVAIVATARKLAVLYYQLMRYGVAYVEQGLAAYEQSYQIFQRKRLQKHAAKLGFNLVPIPA